ncbi:PAS domain-containing sensor histidine kinase [Desulfonema ishimotonii]|uniref:histidine kinase n=1 Tax=Desulfonema ishimotonii TaxID=45657 RepID=A0A401FZC6_9BACT|nr:PAS domain S-box protein [Desulfonema ishimotonii]GBC62315.1 PAS domain-containing sensor histidine kinase [Desulfonema ishimotonii]
MMEMTAIAVGIVVIAGVIGVLIWKLLRQRYEYQTLFESVPCAITVQDRDFRLLRYNREFAENFSPSEGAYCYYAYKGRTRKCEVCPVERTFKDGKFHSSEETRVNRDGSRKYWIVKTAPVKNAKGEIVAAMEMCLDVTHRKLLEEELEKSERKYYAIFNNIPNPVFVLSPETHKILDCNQSVESVYGYSPEEMISHSFLNLFPENERKHYAFMINRSAVINQVRHFGKRDQAIYVNVRVSPSEFLGRHVLLVTISDITKRLEAEQQLSQASKLATLGEMATGVAHELNQPLTVIKMASSFLMKKVRQGEAIAPALLSNMTEKINNNVDRANRIISHMRDFARKSDMSLERVQVNEVLENACDIFSQQLRLREIDVVRDMAERLPVIMADGGRLEQVFINLLVNARDAIEEKWATMRGEAAEKKIFLTTGLRDKKVFVEVSDTGTGISETIRDKIFEPFFTSKEVGKGTGLGLSISYGIVKEFQGEIRVTSNRYNGACFHMEFPIYELTQGAENGR